MMIFLVDDPPCETIVSHIWEHVNDIEALDDPFWSLYDNYICGKSTGNYVVEFASNACNIYERGRSKSPLYVPILFRMQVSDHDILWLPKTCYFFMYEMPMYRKRVRLKSLLLNVLWCARAHLWVLENCKIPLATIFLQ
jgi:hypothetical protein